MNEASEIQKYMILHSKPTTAILVNHMINKYAKTRGIPEYQIKNCVEAKKKAISNNNNNNNNTNNNNNIKLKKPNLRSVKKG
jgi:hypothetical protein